MAGAFTVVFLVVAVCLLVSVRAYVRAGRRRGWLRNPHLPAMLVVLLLFG